MENNLEEIANKIRINTVKEVYYAKSGHPGGSLSIADILAVLYFKEMKIEIDLYCLKVIALQRYMPL